MPKKIIKKFMPKPEILREHKYLRIFGTLLHKPNLWALNRKSAPGAFAVGLFVAFIPIPFQMVVAAGFAILFNVNIPVAVALVWITNPFTMPIIFYGAYLIGAKILGQKPQAFQFEATWAWIEASLSTIGPPFLVGSLVLSIVSALIGYLVIKSMWRYSILFKWQKRKGE